MPYSMQESAYFNLKGVQNNEIIDLKENMSKLVDGRTFTKEEIASGSNVVVISKNLADLNNLSVGSTISLYASMYDRNDIERSYMSSAYTASPRIAAQEYFEFEIIGLFESQKEAQIDKNGDVVFDWANQQMLNEMYTSNKVVSVIQKWNNDKYIELYPEYAEEAEFREYLSPLYVLNDPLELDKLKEEANPYLPEYYKIVDNIESYSSILGPIENIRWIAGIVLYVAVGATLIILSLLITLFLRDRKHEIGIYLSLGERRKNVIMQIVLEVVIVSFLGITLSLFSGNIIAGAISEKMLENQLMQEQNGR